VLEIGTPTRLHVGSLIEYPECPGIGRIGDLDGDRVRIDFFESIVEPVTDSQWLPADSCRSVTLEPETRVYWRNPDTGDWLAGRVKGSSSEVYFVQFPNTEFDFPLPEHELRVRWDRPVRDPVMVLAAGGNESAYFHDARLPLLRNFVDQRAACASTFAFLSSAVELYPHQVNTALTVLSDPVQRYLLADEVGLGKTVEAGFIIRQTLLDNPCARIVVLAPDGLRLQWAQELREKFFIEDFPDAQVKCVAHETPERWAAYHGCELVVVDEAHRVAQTDDPDKPVYRSLCALAHSVPRLILLSATPVMSQHTTQLGMLHLLDPDLYRWTERTAFERRYELRSQLANAIYGLGADYTYLVPSAVEEIRALIPSTDNRYAELSGQVLGLLDENDELSPEADPGELHYRVEELRAHISETYRLHRRVIRHRRDKVLQVDPASEQMPYEVTGRNLPQRLSLAGGDDTAREALLKWRSAVWDTLLDEDQAAGVAAYGLMLGVLTSRVGGSATDLVDALRWRVHRDSAAAERTGLSDLERDLLTSPRLLTAESSVLGALEARLGVDCEHGAQSPAGDTDILVNAMLPALRSSSRTVIFCGPGSLAGSLVVRLRKRFPRVAVHEHTRQAGLVASRNAVLSWSSPSQSGGERHVLVADETAEDGLNLQIADAVLHLRLPWSPNQLEQRLGRVDRYSATVATNASGSARQYLISDDNPDESFADAWTELLEEGYQIFSGSVSTLQDEIASGLEGTWLTGIEFGPRGLREAGSRVRLDLGAARQEIDKMDMLESIHESSIEERDIAAALVEFEQRWRETRNYLLRYASFASGGIGLRHYSRTSGESSREVFDLLESRPLLPPRLLRLALRRVTPTMAEGAFNRSAALRIPGTRLLRRGNPLVDVLANVIAVDDRGQASAIRRVDPDYRGDPEPYFGFDYLVEADITQAVQQVGNRPDAATALRRQADRMLPPFALKAWISPADDRPLTNPARRAWLDRPYDKRNGDLNYSRAQRGELLAVFGGPVPFQRAAEAAEAACREHLAEVTDLEQKCARAWHQARQRIAVTAAQARARQEAGHLVGDAESYLLDVAVTDALTDGLSRPTVRTVAVTYIARTRIERIRRAT
jgi:ATP-dependent helicase HepA